MKNSYIASFLGYLEACYWHKKKLSRLTDKFISPSVFLKTKMIEAGFDADQIAVCPNVMTQRLTPSDRKADYYCYAGRLSEEKGVDTLLEAASRLPFPLKIIGGGPLFETYSHKYACRHITFYGHLPTEEVYALVREARFLVVPSVWYENYPYSVIEALCMGTPVLGAQIGGLPEMIEEQVNGFFFRSGDIPDLTEKLTTCFAYFTDSTDYKKISTDAQNKFGSDTFYSKLMNIYES